MFLVLSSPSFHLCGLTHTHTAAVFPDLFTSGFQSSEGRQGRERTRNSCITGDDAPAPHPVGPFLNRRQHGHRLDRTSVADLAQLPPPTPRLGGGGGNCHCNGLACQVCNSSALGPRENCSSQSPTRLRCVEVSGDRAGWTEPLRR